MTIMSLEISLREISSSLGSSRATDRRKHADSLKELLSRNAVPSMLTANTIKKKGYTWTEMFNDINDYVLKETEKYESSKTFESITIPLISSLLNLCVAGSNKGKAYIKCEQVIEASLFILKDTRLTKAIGDCYLSLLYKHILSCDHYVNHITPTQWEDLLNVCLNVCSSKHCKLDDYTKMRLLLIVIKHAKNSCQFIIPLRDSLSGLKKCFSKFSNDKKVLEVVIEILVLLLETLSLEYRLAMCDFTEHLLPPVLKSYDQNLDQKKKIPLYKLLYLTMMLHHPKGALKTANNFEVWEKQLNSIMEIIWLEASTLQKLVKQNQKMLKPNTDYSNLAASVYYLILNTPSASSSTSSNDLECGNTSKRQRTTINKHRCFTDLAEEVRQNPTPWLDIIHMYIEKYGQTVLTHDYITLVGAIEFLLTNNNTNLNWQSLERTACMAVNNLMSNVENNNEYKDECEVVLLSLWNSCVRTTTLVNSVHKASHSILQALLSTHVVKYEDSQPLYKLYYEKGMPFTDDSLRTLTLLNRTYFYKSSYYEERLKSFGWFTHGFVASVDVSNVKFFLMRLLTNENVDNEEFSPAKSEYEHIHSILFDYFEDSLLFSEFELSIPKPVDHRKEVELMGLNGEINKDVNQYFNTKVFAYIDKIKDIKLLEYIQFINIFIVYIDTTLKCDQSQRETLKQDQLLRLFKNALITMYLSLTTNLKNNKDVLEKVKLLQCVINILKEDYDPMINSLVRTTINDDFFHCINNIMNALVSKDDEVLYEDDDSEINPNILRHNCICLLAAYCKKTEAYTDEVLKLILDPTLYSFSVNWDVEAAFECIDILLHLKVTDPPLESIFTLMQYMCKDLFRNPKVSFRLLKILSKILEKLWLYGDNMQQNCFIMVRSYLQRSLKFFYPPYVAAIVYECAGKIAALNLKQGRELDNNFIEALQNNIKGNTHSLRLYCCYLTKLVFGSLSNEEIESHVKHLTDIFLVEMSERQELIMRDEMTNRTLTILHSAFALTQLQSTYLHTILNQVILLQKEKSLEKRLIKRVLNRISNNIVKKNIDLYLNENILAILNYWFCKDKTLDELPLQIFGFMDINQFIEKHMNWLIAAEILWLRNGDVKESSVIKHVQSKTGKSTESILEGSICNIIALCLPYIVTENYRLSFSFPGKWEWTKSAEIMFQSTRQILGDEKWSTLFAENISDLVLLTATHLKDHNDAKRMYQVKIPKQEKSYHYPKEVFSGILQYFGILIDENVMKYLCENQPLTIFRTLFALWKEVLRENMFEYKVLSLHSYVNFLENIPLGYSSDAFVCNFACNSLAHEIKKSRDNDEIKIYVITLKMVLQKFMKPTNMEILRNSVHKILSILMIKNEEGFSSEVTGLFSYLTEDMKDYLKDNEDVVDFVSSVSQKSVENYVSSTKTEFMWKLKTYQKNLVCPSHETLAQLRQFLQNNRVYVNNLSNEINSKGFSDDCKSSALHQIIYSLCSIIKSATDNKTIIEACNCLAEIGNYDLKTLVTVSPADAQKVVDLRPRQYFASAVLGTLSNVLFDENPTVVSLTAKSLKSVLKYREGKDALDLDCVDKPMLIPFLSSESNEFAEFKINNVKFKSLCSSENWIPRSKECHSEWLIRITLNLLDVLATQTNYLLQLRKVCSSKPSLCRQILPPLIGLILDCSSETHVKIISEQINSFFKHIWDLNFGETVASSYDSSNMSKQSNSLDQDTKMIVQYMLEVVNFVRLQRNHYKPRPERTFDTLNYLRLQYDKVAWAATIADQNMAAIYYGELWCSAGNEGVPPDSPESTTQLAGGENLQRIFRKCFVSIGEMDALDGCGTTHLTIEDERRKHLINTGQYMDSLLLHDIALSCPGQNHDLQYGAVKSLHKSGMHHLALQYIKSLPESDELNDIKYDCLSFLGDWTNFVDTRDLENKSKLLNCNIQSIIKAYRYSCLKDCLNLQVNLEFEHKLVKPLNSAKLAVARLSQNLNLENCQNVYNVLSKLHLFNDIEDYFSVRSDKLSIQNLLKKWKVENMPPCHDFKHVEAMICQRSLILEHAAKTFGDSLKDIVSLQLQYADLSLNNDRIQMAQRLLAVVKRLHVSDDVGLVDAQISWTKGHKDIALSMLRNIVTSPSNDDVKLAAVSLRQYGIWMAKTKCDNTRDIINKYLKKSLETLQGNDHEETRLKIYYDIAKFADAEYKQVVAYMNSSVFEKTVKCVEGMKDTACTLRSTQALTRDERKALAMNDKFGEIDEAIIASTRSEKETFLQLAMRYYLLSLKQGESNNLSVFRVISLWLDNQSLALADAGDQSFEDLLHAIPSYKYVTVLPQLGPRLTNDTSPFVENLKKILKRCAHDHPHHTLPILFSLKNSDKDKIILNASENIRSGSSQRARSQEPRVAAAEVIVSQLANEHTELRCVIEQMEKICDATISFANYLPKTKESKQKIPAAERIHKLGPLDAIPVPTDTIPISKDCKYSNIPTIYSFENYFELVGGINCPKKIICRRSDAKNRILLIKGEDDLRQDAVMQQVFNIVNMLLEQDTVTSRNKLLIRTYKVVPMSRKSGVLEWCEGTIPIGLYLVGNNGAHMRYRPQDITASAARSKLNNLYEKRKSHREKLIAFLKILKEFRPVFHYFFTEHYLDPVTWFERRLAYTKSVATSSMVGYILGLGDRHLQNILIDKKTAEVVHIDFGIAFEQGKTLPTPETIPFRLTQDIIAGFGCSGVEGIFRRCCEKTMQLLRDNQETLLTILEVLLCDPLYSWTVTSKQQNVLTAPSRDVTVNHSGSDGSLAKRALMTVSNKLSGTEGGVAGGVSVPGQVARLIQTATDPANLSRLFPGWQPYL